uniref:Uncharacterized protein n=1 Tax=Peromyscus maniculatus bairdii TaxID=230844 RepID=A0A8C8W1W9_PERMB
SCSSLVSVAVTTTLRNNVGSTPIRLTVLGYSRYRGNPPESWDYRCAPPCPSHWVPRLSVTLDGVLLYFPGCSPTRVAIHLNLSAVLPRFPYRNPA